jgi:hypothetical protein
MLKPRFVTLTGMIVGAAMLRLLPHPWNMTPVAALSLFAGAKLGDKRAAFLIPLSAVFISDLALGFYSFWPLVYLAHASVVFIGMWLRKRSDVFSLLPAALAGSLSFFFISNLAHYFSSGLYPLTSEGLIQCYLAAIPFFRNALIGDLFFSAVLFGGFRLAEIRFPVLRPSEG